jgi:hypothetical protein
LKYLINDWFETITLYENKATDATYVKKNEEQYEVTLKFTSELFRADSAGNEKPLPLNKQWIDVGVYTKNKAGEDKLLYLQKHPITQKDNTVTVIVSEKPTKAGIDPINKLVDRHPEDNTKTVSEGGV